MSYYEAKQARNRALLRALGHLEEPEEPTEAEGKVDFDGGVREPAPLRSNPEQDHSAFITQLLQEHRGGDGPIDFGPLAGPAPSSPAEPSAEGESEDWRKG